jgi:anti-sigma factor RsiW
MADKPTRKKNNGVKDVVHLLETASHLTVTEMIAFVDDDLPAKKTISVKRHLDGCGDCRSRVEDYRRAMKRLSL